MAVSVRGAEPSDVLGLVRLGRATWRAAMAPLTDDAYVAAGLRRWWVPSVVGRHVESGDVLLAEARDELLLGLALVESEAEALELRRLYVAPRSQGLGVGTALLTGVLERAEAHTNRRVRLTVLSANTIARRFYQARGFRDCGAASGDAEPYPQQLMELSLR